VVSYPYVLHRPWAQQHHLPFDDASSDPLYHHDHMIFHLLDHDHIVPYPCVHVHLGLLGLDNPFRLYLDHLVRDHDVYLLDHDLLLGLYLLLYLFDGLGISILLTRKRLYIHTFVGPLTSMRGWRGV
jgi:hypothetical protein